MDMLTLSHVSKNFGSRQVLQDLSFSVPEHSVFGFIGENGAGKTTTMKLILGLLPADKGTILVGGSEVRYGSSQTNCHIGYLPDVPEFYSFMTPTEYLNFCGEISGMPAKDRRSRAGELLELVGLSAEKRRIQGFSRGMKQRLGIAQALMNRPRLLICDEPTSALDPVGRKEILDILTAAREQTTVLFSTHILSDVERICDHIALLHHGSVAMQGTLEEIKAMHTADCLEIELEHTEDTGLLLSLFPQCQQTGPVQLTLHLSDSSQTAAILGALTTHQIAFRKIQRMEPTLESLFMEVTGK